MAPIRLNVLGPIEVESPMGRHRLPSAIQRTTLAVLLTHLGSDVSAGRIVESVWRETDVDTAHRRLWFHMSRLRTFLGERGATSDIIITGAGTYRIEPRSVSLDAQDFMSSLKRGRSLIEEDPLRALEALDTALALWRGAPYEDVPTEAIGWAESVRLEEARLSAVELRFDALSALGRESEIVEELETVITANPYREVFRAQLMRAFYRTGRQADALAVYRNTREVLLDELGIDPSPSLQQLELEILEHSRGLRMPPLIEALEQDAAIPRQVVGRSQEIERLESALDDSAASRVRSIFVAGEAGMGKTELLRLLARRVHARNRSILVLVGGASSRMSRVSPLDLFRRVFENGLAGPQADVIRATVEKHGPSLAGVLLDTSVSGDAAHKPPHGALSSSPAAQCVEAILALGEAAPVLLILDDLQWSDDTSLDVVEALARGTGSIVIVGAYRPEELQPPIDANRLREIVHLGDEIDLADVESPRSIVDAMLDREPNNFSEAFRDDLTRVSGGNPLFVLEFLDDLRQRGSIALDEGLWREAAGWSWDATPTRIGAVLTQRFDRLPTEVRRAIDVACVEGIEFTADVIASVIDLPISEVVDLLSRSASAHHRLVEAIGPSRIGDSPVLRYRFRHSIIQEHAYGDLDHVVRAHLHGAVGSEIQRRAHPGDTAWAGVIGRHFELAGVPERAIHAMKVAADAAIRLGATVEAERVLTLAVHFVESIPDGPLRDSEELDLQLRLGLVRSTNEGFSAGSVERAYSRANALMLAGADNASSMRAYFGLWTYTLSRSDLDGARVLADRIVEIASSTDDDGLLLQALHTRWTEAMFRGDLVTTVRTSRKAMAIYRHEDHHPLAFRYGNHDAGVCALILAALARALAAEHDVARTLASQSTELAAVLRHPISMAQSRLLAPWLHVLEDDPERTLEAIDGALRDLEDVHVPLWKGVALAIRAWALGELGRTSDAVEVCELVLTPGRFIPPGDIFSVPVATMTAAALLRAGEPARADQLTRDSVARVEGRDHFYAAEAYRTRAIVVAARGDEDAASVLLRLAHERSEAIGARALTIRAATTAVELGIDGRASFDRLRAAIVTAPAQVDRPYLARARSLTEARP